MVLASGGHVCSGFPGVGALRMKTFWWSLFAVYVSGFVVIFILNLHMGPVEVPLAFIRAVVWPYWIATGRPEGERRTPY